MNEHDGYGDLRFTAPANGVITRNDDPKKIGRCRVRVPGLLEPESGWALPLTVGGGSADRGIYFPPDVGAECLVFFKHGDPDHPYFCPANWRAPGGTSEVNERVRGKSAAEAVKVKVIETERWLIIMDSSSGSPGFSILDKNSGGLDTIEFDGLTRALSIKATASISIQAIGTIDIQGLAVTINGRPVLTSTDPI